jgi:hypothetical protein
MLSGNKIKDKKILEGRGKVTRLDGATLAEI